MVLSCGTMASENTEALMTQEFPICPICKSTANYWVNPLGLIVQCKHCGTKFVSEDFNTQEPDKLASLVLRSPPSTLVDEDVRVALSTLKDRVLPVDFWRTLNLDRASITAAESATRDFPRQAAPRVFGEGPSSDKESSEYGILLLLYFAVTVPSFLYMWFYGPNPLIFIFLVVFIIVVTAFVQLRYHPPRGTWHDSETYGD